MNDIFLAARFYRAGMLHERLLAAAHGIANHQHEFHYGSCQRCAKRLDSKDLYVQLNEKLIAERIKHLTLDEYSNLALHVEAANDEAWKELER